MKKDYGFRLGLAILVLVLAVWSLIPTIRVYSKNSDPHLPYAQREREIFKKENPKVANKALNLGLDLAGGTHIIVEVQKDKIPEDRRATVVDQSLEIIRNRVDQYGLSEPVISRSGDSRIVADLAGMEAEDARNLIGATAILEFKLVSEGNEIAPILDRLDAFLNKHGGIVPKDDGKGAPAAAAPADVFGRVDNAAGAPDTIKAAPDSAGRPASDTALAQKTPADSATALAKADTGKTDSAAARDSGLAAGDTGVNKDLLRTRPFSSLLMALGNDIAVRQENVDKVRKILAHSEVQAFLPSKYQFLWSREVEKLDNGTAYRRLYLLKRRPEMTGTTIAEARAQRDQSGGFNQGQMEVSLTFKGLGPKEFSRITGANVGRQLAIVLDSVVYSAPVIQGKIPNGRASITGLKDVKEAKQLEVCLNAGALPAPMTIVELRSVGPTLGEKNIQQGMNAALISLFLVAGFIVLYYRLSGLLSVLALGLNMVLIFAVLSAFHATLTLPGIAGIVLTIGMAVDANVLIFERIREELAAGRSVRASIDAGYRKAFSAIFDANITTLGTAAILYQVGVGPIKGFGLTLIIGILASMFTAVFVTRLVYDILLSRRDIRQLSLGKGLPWLHNIDLKVIKHARIYVGISLAVIAIGILSILFHRGLNLGIDFTGGSVYQLRFDQSPDVEKVREEISRRGGFEPRVQTLDAVTSNELLVYTPKTGNDSLARLAVLEAAPGAKLIGEEEVGPKVGKELKRGALFSIALALLLIVLYVWFRFGINGLGFGLAAVVALAHDSFVTLGIFSLLDRQISLDFVAAVLTIVGFSVNDTIVIFDRVRELMGGTGAAASRESFAQKVNTANNQCFSRTIITSLTVLMTVVVLTVFGGSSIRDFNLAMVIGVISGSYSTIAIACPFVVWWDKRRAIKLHAPAVKKPAPATT